MKRYLKSWQWLSLAILFITCPLMLLTSCGNDEPDTVIDYYISVEEEYLINGSSDHTSMFKSPVVMAREAIRKAYPTPNTKGDDLAVIAACDQAQEEFQAMYNGRTQHFTCLYHLMRAVKVDNIVRQSEELKTYIIDINPTDINPDE